MATNQYIEQLKAAFEERLVSELVEHGGIPPHPPAEIALREAIALLLAKYQEYETQKAAAAARPADVMVVEDGQVKAVDGEAALTLALRQFDDGKLLACVLLLPDDTISVQVIGEPSYAIVGALLKTSIDLRQVLQARES